MRDGDDQSAVDRLWGALSGWAADARAEEAARSRAREGWLRRQAAAEATLAGYLVDLSEQNVEVLVDLAAGERTARGYIRAVGLDFTVLTSRAGQLCLIATDAIVGVRSTSTSRSSDPSGDRPPPLDTGLTDALALLASDRPPVQLILKPAGRSVSGQLAAVGLDVVTLEAAGSSGTPKVSPVAVATSAIAMCQVG